MNLKTIIILVILILFFFSVTLMGNDLHDAIQKGDVTKVKTLISNHNELINMKSEKGETPLHLAVQNGSQEIVEFLISQGADINAKENEGNTPLISALALKKTNIARFLISKGADVKIKNAQNQPAAILALMNGLNELIAPILDNGQDVNERFDGNLTILLMATLTGNKDVIKLLVDRGADINAAAQEGDMTITPMYAAVFLGHRDVVDIFLSRGGVDKDFRDKPTGRTLLHIAVLKGVRDIVGLLINAGYDVNATDNGGKTPLHYASKHGHKKITELLLQNGARAENLKENFGMSPLLKKKLKAAEAAVWYLGASGWAIKTKSKLLIFDYHVFGPNADEPWLANGHINPEEIKDQDVYVFATHEHEDHFNPVIFDWKKSIDSIKYILGFAPEKASEAAVLLPREMKTIDGMEVSTIASTDAGVGFLVKVDGLTIFHAGDHACKQKDLKGPYAAEIDYLANKCKGVDFAFLPITGCGFRDPEAVKSGIYYTLERLKPDVVFPMHVLGFESQYEEFARDAEKENTKTKFACAENKGDYFLYTKGKIKK